MGGFLGGYFAVLVAKYGWGGVLGILGGVALILTICGIVALMSWIHERWTDRY